MGDHHQVKTSFLFIQLQSPSRAQHCQPSAEALSLVTSEEVSSATTAADVARPSVGDLESICTREEENLPTRKTAYKDTLDDTVLLSVDSKPIPEEAPSPLFAAGITEKNCLPDLAGTDIRPANQDPTSSSSWESKTHSQECLNSELNKPLNSVPEKDNSVDPRESSIWHLCQDPPETMSEVIPSPSLGNFPKPSLGPRVSFLYPSTESDSQNRTTPRSPDVSPTPSGIPPACTPTSTFPSTHRLSQSSWVHSAKQKEEAAALERTQTVLSTNAERTTFVSAVIRRSSVLYGDVCIQAHSSFEVTSDVDEASKNHSLAVEGTGKPNQTALNTESLHTETAQSTMLQSTAPEKVSLA